MTSLAATRPFKSLSLYSTGEILFIVKPSFVALSVRYQVKSAPGHCGPDLTK